MDLFIPALAASHHHHHHALHPHHASPFPHGLEIPANFAQHLIESTTSWIQRNSAAAVGQATSSSAIPGHQHHRQQQHHHHHATQIHVIHDPIIFPASAAAAAAAHAAAASSGMPSASSGSSAIESDVSPSTSLSSYSPSSCSSSNQENNGSISHPVPCNLLLDVHKGKAIRLRVKVAVPVEDHPNVRNHLLVVSPFFSSAALFCPFLCLPFIPRFMDRIASISSDVSSSCPDSRTR